VRHGPFLKKLQKERVIHLLVNTGLWLVQWITAVAAIVTYVQIPTARTSYFNLLKGSHFYVSK